jgi:predicted Rossmann-fold nucleotide-binding protein
MATSPDPTRAELVAFPGGYGTLDELFEALNLSVTREIDPIPIVLAAYRDRSADQTLHE